MKLRKLNKKASHVGMILSFVIFVTFLIYIFSVLEPTIKTGPPKTDSLGILKNRVLTDVTSELVTITYKLNLSEDSKDETCLEIPLKDDYSDLNISVVNMDDNVINSYKQEGSVVFENPEEDFIKIKHVNFDINSSYSCSDSFNLESKEYAIQSIKIREYVFVSEILDFLKEYDSNYTNLKNSLGVATGDEFAIDFKYENGTILSSREKFPDKNIFVKDVSVQYVDMKTKLNLGELKIKIW